jgi:hypothetical protein
LQSAGLGDAERLIDASMTEDGILLDARIRFGVLVAGGNAAVAPAP